MELLCDGRACKSEHDAYAIHRNWKPVEHFTVAVVHQRNKLPVLLSNGNADNRRIASDQPLKSFCRGLCLCKGDTHLNAIPSVSDSAPHGFTYV